MATAIATRISTSLADATEFFAQLPRCRAGLEACGDAHHWGHELAKLGHEVRLIPPQYVKAYVKTNKHDAADAAACCEAVQRPGMVKRVALDRAGQERATAVDSDAPPGA